MNKRLHWLTSMVFAVGLLTVGCTAAQKAEFGKSYTKVAAATTQAATSVGEVSGVIAATTPGTPLGDVAILVTAISGGILALEKIVTPIVNRFVATPAPDSGQANMLIPPSAIVGTVQQPPKQT